MNINKTLAGTSHLEPLTWLRAIAAFLVVVSHSIRTAEVQYSPNDEKSWFLPLNLLDQGSFGVCLFFALSGCTLYLSNSKLLFFPGSIAGFYIKRLMRIWPAYAFSMIVYIVFAEIFYVGYSGDPKFWIAQFLTDYSLINVFQYLSLTFNITGPSGLFIGPYWSLPVEFQYYLILPFAIVLMTNKLRSVLIPVVFGATLYAVYKYSLIRVDRTEVFHLGFVFFGGVLLASMSSRYKFRMPASVGVAMLFALIASVGLVVTGIVILPENLPFVSDKWNYYGVSGVLCVGVALFSRTPSAPKPVRAFLNEYGDISYSIYLFHMVFIGISAIAITRFEIFGNITKLMFILVFSVFQLYFFKTNI